MIFFQIIMAASGLKFTVLLPSAHRVGVKISSKETLVREVLEDACKKKCLNPDLYELRHNRKVRPFVFYRIKAILAIKLLTYFEFRVLK